MDACKLSPCQQAEEIGVVVLRSEHERRAAGDVVAARRGEVDVCAAVKESDGHLGVSEHAGDAERCLAIGVDGVGGCKE